MADWIWSDRNCLPWAKVYLTRKLKVVHGGAFVITSVASIDGDCDLNQKRGKAMPVYDLQIVLTWKGTDSSGAHASGQISIPEFMHDSEMVDIEMVIVVDDKKQQMAVRKEVINALIPAVKQVLASFKRDMIAENTKSAEKNSPTPASSAKTESSATPHVVPPPHQAPKLDPVWIGTPTSATSKLKTASFGLETQFACTASDIYDSFLNPERVKIWTRDKGVVLDPRPGQELILFGGNVSGRLFELVPCSKIVFTWRLKSWPPSLQSSLVTLLIDEFDKVVRVRVKHVDAPADEIAVIKRNWEAYYFTPIRESLHILATIPKVTAVVAAKPLVNAEEYERMSNSARTAAHDESHDSKERMSFWFAVLYIFLFC
ncbi:activator of Hsp90 ATPase [Chytriomyces cf. hyalinus JEL632]|nr:activator of Hsp90 ATPase [Chytriomyces cf. hyalinus JEL632]